MYILHEQNSPVDEHVSCRWSEIYSAAFRLYAERFRSKKRRVEIQHGHHGGLALGDGGAVGVARDGDDAHDQSALVARAEADAHQGGSGLGRVQRD